MTDNENPTIADMLGKFDLAIDCDADGNLTLECDAANPDAAEVLAKLLAALAAENDAPPF